MSGTTTPNYGFSLPAIGGNQDTWGNLLNANWTTADSAIHGLASGYLPLTGGTLNGNLILNGRIVFGNLGAGAHGMEFGWGGSGVIQAFVDGNYEGDLATLQYLSSAYLPLTGGTLNGGLTVGGSLSISGAQVSDFTIYRGAPYRVLQWESQWNIAFNDATGDTTWNGPGTQNMLLDGSGNLSVRGNITVGARLTSNDIMSNTGAFFVGGSGVHYLARSNADGYWRFVEDSTVNLTLDPAGNLTARGQVHGSNVTAMTDRIGELAARVEELTARVADLEALRLA